jgi:hypothetical protein
VLVTASTSCIQVRDLGVLITLEPKVIVSGDKVDVGVYAFVACLDALWLTYVVQPTAGHTWQVTGTTGSMAIA